MSKRELNPLLIDMLEAIADALNFTQGHNYESFIADNKTRHATLRCIQVIGKAANRIPKEKRDEHQEIEWSRIIRSRNIIVHEYDAVDYEVIWKIVTVYLPPLKSSIEKIIHKHE